MASRIVQWTTGNVGRQALRSALEHPDLEVVGCYVTPEGGKAGRDVAELAGVDGTTGVLATSDVDALLALAPDAALYTPKFNDVDEMVRLLSAGVNVVATAGFVTGHCLGAETRERLTTAAVEGGVSLFGSGMNPGFANLLGVVATGICERVERVTVLESVDSTGYDSPETEQAVGFGRPVDEAGLVDRARAGTAVFEDAVHLTAAALGVELDEVVFEAEFAATTEDVDLGSWTIPAGGVAGVGAAWQGVVDGRTVVDLRVRWRKGRTLDPDWRVEHGYVVEVLGSPSARMRYEILPPPGFVAESMADFMVLGMIATALPAVHAVPAVCTARPGIVTYLDLPLVTARGAAGPV